MARQSRQRMNMTAGKGSSMSLLILAISLTSSPVAAFVPASQPVWNRVSTTTRRHWGDTETIATAAATTTTTATSSCRLFLEGSANPRLQYAGTCSKLFSSSSSSSSENENNNRLRRPLSLIQRFRQQSSVGGIRQQFQSMRISKVTRKFKRGMLVLMMAAIFWTCTKMTLPAHAETASSAASAVSIGTLQPDKIETVSSKTSKSHMDRMIDRYVKQHMFDDEPYDPVASLYREAHDDATVGAYPNALRQVMGSVLGQQEGGKVVLRDGGAAAAAVSDRTAGGSMIGNFFTNSIQFLQKWAHFSEQTAVMVLAGLFVIAGPTFFLFSGMIVGGISKRNMNKTMKKRYGDTYTVDATIKTEEEVEAPDDDEDEDDEDDDDEEDEDDVDEDDDDEKKDDKKKKDGKKKK